MKKFLSLFAAVLMGVASLSATTVKAKMPSDWGSTISVYTWSGGESNQIVPATADGEWYSYTTSSTSFNIIFINGTNWNGDANQTVDIAVSGDMCLQLGEGTGKRSATHIDCTTGEEQEVGGVVYTLVGELPLLTESWNPAASQYDMTLQADGSYQIVITTTLSAGTYQFKVTDGHAWGGFEIPASGNQELTVDEAGQYQITFTLSADLTTLTANPVKVGDSDEPIVEPIEGDYFIKHPFDGSNWVWQAMTEAGDGTYTYTSTWGGVGANIHTSADDNGAQWFPQDQIAGAGSLVMGASVTFVYNPTAGTLSIDGAENPETPVVPGGSKVWYVFGYINGKDYNEFEMPFVDGVATLVDITADSYIFVHEYNSGEEWFTNGWTDGAATVTMINGKLISEGHNKLLVPVGTQYVYLCENADGSLTVSREQLDCTGETPVNPPVVGENYYIKHPWGTGADADWAWQEMYAAGDGTYTYTGLWGGVGANINTTDADAGATWFPMDQISGADALTMGEEVTFVYNVAAGTLSIANGSGIEQVLMQSEMKKIMIDGQLYIRANGHLFNAQGGIVR